MKSQIICALAFTLFLIFLVLFIPLFIISDNFQDFNSPEGPSLEPELPQLEMETDGSGTLIGKVVLDFTACPYS